MLQAQDFSCRKPANKAALSSSVLLISPSGQSPPRAAPRAACTQPAMEPPEQGWPRSPSSGAQLLGGYYPPLISAVAQCLKLLFYLLHLISSCGEIEGEGNKGVQAVGASRHPDFPRQSVYASCPGITVNNVLFCCHKRPCWEDK